MAGMMLDHTAPTRRRPSVKERLGRAAFAALYRSVWFHWSLLGPVLVIRYMRTIGGIPKLRNPATMNEKVLYRLLFDRRAFLPMFSGKVEARAHVLAATGDPSLLVDLVGVAATTAELKALRLPPAFVVKANHLSGFMRIYDGSTPVDLDELGRAIEGWCRHYGKLEWGYKQVRRVAVVEHLLEHDGKIPNDYKLFCFDGVVRFIQVDGDRFSEHHQDFFDRDWNWLDVTLAFPNHATPPARPALLDDMIRVAERLSAGVDFVRVDLYAVGDRVKFGELTVYPQSGKAVFKPTEWDTTFGAAWRLSVRDAPALAMAGSGTTP